MSLGEVAGMIAAVAAVALVAFCAVPLLKLGRVLEELRLSVRDLGHHSVPILQELRGTVAATNEEIGKLALVTEDVAKVSKHASVVTENAAQLATIFRSTLGGPLIKTAAFTYGVRQAIKAGPSGKSGKRGK